MTKSYSPRFFIRIAIRAIFGMLIMALLLSLYSVLQVRTAVAQGALETPAFGCIDPAHLDRRAELVDRAFVRSVAAFNRLDAQHSLDWHASQVLASIGVRLAYSRAEREALVLPSLEALPACKR